MEMLKLNKIKGNHQGGYSMYLTFRAIDKNKKVSRLKIKKKYIKKQR